MKCKEITKLFVVTDSENYYDNIGVGTVKKLIIQF